MTPEERALIAQLIKLVIFTPGLTTKKRKEYKKLIDLAIEAGMKDDVDPGLINSFLNEHDDTICKEIDFSKIKVPDDFISTQRAEVEDMYMECVVEKESELYKMLETVCDISRPFDLTDVAVLKRREAVGRDDVEVFELQIGKMSIKKAKEVTDADDSL